jgi:hypothetical protein
VSARAFRFGAASALALTVAAAPRVQAAFEWRPLPPAAAVPLAEGRDCGPLALFASPAYAMGPRAAAFSYAYPYALGDVRAGAAAFSCGARLGFGCGAAWLAHPQYREHEVVAALSCAVGVARAGASVRALEVSIDGCEPLRAVAHDAGIVIRPADRLSLAACARSFLSGGAPALRASVAPAVSASAAFEVCRGLCLLGERSQSAGYPASSACGISWSPARALRWGVAVRGEPASMRTALAIALRGLTLGAAYDERPPLPPTVSASIDVRG